MAFSEPISDFTQRGRKEAAAKLSKNKDVVRAGVLLAMSLHHKLHCLPVLCPAMTSCTHAVAYCCISRVCVCTEFGLRKEVVAVPIKLFSCSIVLAAILSCPHKIGSIPPPRLEVVSQNQSAPEMPMHASLHDPNLESSKHSSMSST